LDLKQPPENAARCWSREPGRIVVIQFVAETTFQVLIAVPIIGATFRRGAARTSAILAAGKALREIVTR